MRRIRPGTTPITTRETVGSIDGTRHIFNSNEPDEVFVSHATATLMGKVTTTEVDVFELNGIEGKATLYRVV